MMAVSDHLSTFASNLVSSAPPGPRRTSMAGFALELASEKFSEGNIFEGRQYVAVIAELAPEMQQEIQTAVYKHLSIVKGSSAGNLKYGKECFHYLNGLSATGIELAQAVDNYLRSLDLAQISRLSSLQTELDTEVQEPVDPRNNDYFLCSFTKKVFRDPVMDHCGHSFEEAHIRNLLADPVNKTICPFSGEPIEANELRPNHGLKSAILASESAEDAPKEGESLEERIDRILRSNINLAKKNEKLAAENRRTTAENRRANERLTVEITMRNEQNNILRLEARKFLSEYVGLRRRCEQLQQAVNERDGEVHEKQVTNNRVVAENNRLQGEKCDLQNTVQQQEGIIAERGGTIAEQNRTIAEQNRTIAERDRTIAERNRTVEERNRTVEERDRTIAEQNRTIQELRGIIEEWGRRIAQQAATILRQNTIIVQRDAAIERQGAIIVQHRAAIEQQGVVIERQGAIIVQHGTAIEQQGVVIEAQSMTVRQIEERFRLQNERIRTEFGAIQQNLQTLRTRLAEKEVQIRNLENMGFGDAVRLAAAPVLCTDRQTVVRQIMNNGN